MFRLIDMYQHVFNPRPLSNIGVVEAALTRWFQSVMPTSLLSIAAWKVFILFSWTFVKARERVGRRGIWGSAAIFLFFLLILSYNLEAFIQINIPPLLQPNEQPVQ